MQRIHGGLRLGEGEGVLDFSSNLNPLGTPAEVESALRECVNLGAHKLYPDPNYLGLREALSGFYGVPKENLVPTNGACEALNLVLTALKLMGYSKLVLVVPTFADKELLSLAENLGYKVYIHSLRETPEGFTLEVNTLRGKAGGRGSVLLLSNPNNPTGSYTPSEVLHGIAEELNVFLVIDGAYAEFLENNPPPPKAGNVAVIRTLTKVFSAPGLRLGSVISRSNRLLELVDTLRPTWNVGSLSECTYRKVLGDRKRVRDFLVKTREVLRKWRNYMAGRLKEVGLKVYPSVVNYFLVKHEGIDAERLSRELFKAGFAVRRADTFIGLTPYFSRLSVREPREVDSLLEALRGVLKSD